MAQIAPQGERRQIQGLTSFDGIVPGRWFMATLETSQDVAVSGASGCDHCALIKVWVYDPSGK